MDRGISVRRTMRAQSVERLDVLLAARSSSRAKATQAHLDVRIVTRPPLKRCRVTYWYTAAAKLIL